MTVSWRPVFSGDPAAQILAIVEDIAAAISGGPFEPPANVDPSVAEAWRYSLDGLAGQSLLHAYLALHGAGEARADTRAEARADTAIDLLDRATDAAGTLTLPPSLYFGFSGISWVAAHLTGRLFEESQDNLRDVDDALLGALELSSFTGKFDLFDGLVGIGVYALERVPRPSAVRLVEAVVSRIAAQAEHTEDGAAFFSAREHLLPAYRELFPNGTYNLGVAHGIAGVISLLGSVCRAGVAAEQARPLLVDSVSWLLAREHRDDGKFRFRNTYTPYNLNTDISRLAWCHGDLGVAMALLVAARGIGEESWEAHARRLALGVAARRFEDTPAPDAGICHGAAGIGHVFNRLYQATGEEPLGDAARAWLSQAVAMREPGLGIGGYRMFQSGKKYDHPGARIGAGGVGLALLAAISPVPPEWDRLLLASSPGTT